MIADRQYIKSEEEIGHQLSTFRASSTSVMSLEAAERTDNLDLIHDNGSLYKVTPPSKVSLLIYLRQRLYQRASRGIAVL